MNRYEQARTRAGLSRAQAARMLGFPTNHIECGAETPTPDRHAEMARGYHVTECWLSGHHPTPDMTALAQQAQDRGVSEHDWDEIALLVQSQSTCSDCAAVSKPPPRAAQGG
jgi:hypothetical protein